MATTTKRRTFVSPSVSVSSRLQADAYQLSDIDGLEFLRDSLEFLGLGQTKRRRVACCITTLVSNMKSGTPA